MSEPDLRFCVQPGGVLRGRLRVPGDKSVSHRAVMLGALAEGTTTVSGFLDGEDCLRTVEAFRAMGVRIERTAGTALTIHGVGLHGLQAPGSALNLGNSGTSMRLMTGVLSGQSFDTTLTGDASLSRRPMGRIVDPLRSMGARIDTASDGNGTAPLVVHGGAALHGIEYPSPVASAQIKSGLLLAGLYARGVTRVIEPGVSRDHTERMLQAFGVSLECRPGQVALQGGQQLRATAIEVPADISSAAFFMVGAAMTPGSELVLESVGVNPTRDGVIEILRRMGADIELLNPRQQGAEPVADIRVRGGVLHGITIDRELVTLAIDEMPAVFIAAASASGETVVRDAAELRVKESDRIRSMCDGLQRLGIDAQGTPDGARIHGGRIGAGQVDSMDDHRVAMSFAIAGLRASGPMEIQRCANVNTSFPGFVATARQAGLKIREAHGAGSPTAGDET